MTTHTDDTLEETVRFAQALRGHPALLVLLPTAWRWAHGTWYDERGNNVAREDVIARLDDRLQALWGFYPTKLELAYVHDQLLTPLFDDDAIHHFLHRNFRPADDGSVPLDELWSRWCKFPKRTTITRERLLAILRDRGQRLESNALLGWCDGAVKLQKRQWTRARQTYDDDLTPKQRYNRKMYAEAEELGVAVPGNYSKTYEALRELRKNQ